MKPVNADATGDPAERTRLPVEGHRAALPVLQLGRRPDVVGLFPHLLALRQHLLDLIGPQGQRPLQTLHQLTVIG